MLQKKSDEVIVNERVEEKQMIKSSPLGNTGGLLIKTGSGRGPLRGSVSVRKAHLRYPHTHVGGAAPPQMGRVSSAVPFRSKRGLWLSIKLIGHCPNLKKIATNLFFRRYFSFWKMADGDNYDNNAYSPAQPDDFIPQRLSRRLEQRRAERTNPIIDVSRREGEPGASIVFPALDGHLSRLSQSFEEVRRALHSTPPSPIRRRRRSQSPFELRVFEHQIEQFNVDAPEGYVLWRPIVTPKLECIICYDMQPYWGILCCEQCHKTYVCSKCFSRLEKCPTCRKRIE